MHIRLKSLMHVFNSSLLATFHFVVGNQRNNSCRYSPSSSPDVITVEAIQEATDAISNLPGHMLYWFNSLSNSPGTNYGQCVDVFAPGQWIRSASHR